MKQTIKITLNGKTTKGEVNTRNEMHFEVQKNNRAQVFKSKKGKGSYTRKSKYRETY